VLTSNPCSKAILKYTNADLQLGHPYISHLAEEKEERWIRRLSYSSLKSSEKRAKKRTHKKAHMTPQISITCALTSILDIFFTLK